MKCKNGHRDGWRLRAKSAHRCGNKLRKEMNSKVYCCDGVRLWCEGMYFTKEETTWKT
jgi:hypothetical protein